MSVTQALLVATSKALAGWPLDPEIAQTARLLIELVQAPGVEEAMTEHALVAVQPLREKVAEVLSRDGVGVAMTTVERVLDEIKHTFVGHGFRLEIREERGTTWVDLVGRNVDLRSYANGPDVTLAILAAEQRWLVEQEGRGSMPGESYVEKARERLRRALARGGGPQ